MRHEINCPLVSAGGSQLECRVQFLVLQLKEEVGQTVCEETGKLKKKMEKS